MASEVAELKTKSEDLLDKYRRSIAENDNMRKRLTKQIEDAKVFGIQGFCKDLLDVADVLSKAVEAGEASQAGNDVKDMVEGLRLTQTQLLQVIFFSNFITLQRPKNCLMQPMYVSIKKYFMSIK